MKASVVLLETSLNLGKKNSAFFWNRVWRTLFKSVIPNAYEVSKFLPKSKCPWFLVFMVAFYCIFRLSDFLEKGIPAFFTLFLFPGHKELILRNLKIHFDRMLKEDFLCNVGFDV